MNTDTEIFQIIWWMLQKDSILKTCWIQVIIFSEDFLKCAIVMNMENCTYDKTILLFKSVELYRFNMFFNSAKTNFRQHLLIILH